MHTNCQVIQSNPGTANVCQCYTDRMIRGRIMNPAAQSRFALACSLWISCLRQISTCHKLGLWSSNICFIAVDECQIQVCPLSSAVTKPAMPVMTSAPVTLSSSHARADADYMVHATSSIRAVNVPSMPDGSIRYTYIYSSNIHAYCTYIEHIILNA